MVRIMYFRLVTFQVILLIALSINLYAKNRIVLTGGVLAGQSLSESKWTIYVEPKEYIEGNIECKTYNSNSPDAVVPFGYTWTWGKRESSIVTIDKWIPTGGRNWDIPIDLKAPSEPKTYYVIFGTNGEFNMEQVFSSTSWVYRKIVWYDGNDFHDMDDKVLFFAHENGYIQNWPYLNDTGYHVDDVPVMPIKVIVKPKIIEPKVLEKKPENKPKIITETETKTIKTSPTFSEKDDSDLLSNPWFIGLVTTIIGGIIVYIITRNFIF
ncbi:MAG: hypothetical protein JW984_15640 [Deltaproteobacteria bacterium]|uniref:Uncharacterized protein n=1 Tax=Candidatus Zymogenus saltonus TaxID=2844893 RepID=A0A9D8KGI7_9DELT|nr:hypothetical protein [Candidatus Zymogenus saltonus]